MWEVIFVWSWLTSNYWVYFSGDFNYFSNLKLDPSHELCLSVYNGYNPMNVSVSSWYQVLDPVVSALSNEVFTVRPVLAPVLFRVDGQIGVESNGSQLADQR